MPLKFIPSDEAIVIIIELRKDSLKSDACTIFLVNVRRETQHAREFRIMA